MNPGDPKLRLRRLLNLRLFIQFLLKESQDSEASKTGSFVQRNIADEIPTPNNCISRRKEDKKYLQKNFLQRKSANKVTLLLKKEALFNNNWIS